MATILRMTQLDLNDVYNIEKNAHITPWSKKIIHDCIAVNYGCYVLVQDNAIYGFMIFRVVSEECHLLNLCVAPKFQGQGVGKSLLVFLLDLVRPHCKSVLLEVRPSNKVALKLYETHNFTQTGIKKDYYTDNGNSHEDAIVLELFF